MAELPSRRVVSAMATPHYPTASLVFFRCSLPINRPRNPAIAHSMPRLAIVFLFLPLMPH
ncbi:hypothetical protein E2562_005645 [Oryza meyeriana var. granulata]|uniref:Uncharacterized protein n=1 Tax=Oryza meyeriana var. granulata TaxID=110450 RepID=A0A6G1BJQ4_9ORYZ|nr:hypothetical protein E2562_005645 [Oryza meyeriana var. granulata]